MSKWFHISYAIVMFFTCNSASADLQSEINDLAIIVNSSTYTVPLEYKDQVNQSIARLRREAPLISLSASQGAAVDVDGRDLPSGLGSSGMARALERPWSRSPGQCQHSDAAREALVYCSAPCSAPTRRARCARDDAQGMTGRGDCVRGAGVSTSRGADPPRNTAVEAADVANPDGERRTVPAAS